MALTSIERKFNHLKKEPLNDWTAGPVAGNIYKWEAAVLPPPASPYAGGVLMLDIRFPLEYPSRPPKVRFNTKKFHSNINERGSIDLNILKPEYWKPWFTISKVLSTICSLLTEPVLDDPLILWVTDMFKTDQAKFNSTARMWTEMYAMGRAE